MYHLRGFHPGRVWELDAGTGAGPGLHGGLRLDAGPDADIDVSSFPPWPPRTTQGTALSKAWAAGHKGGTLYEVLLPGMGARDDDESLPFRDDVILGNLWIPGVS